MVKSFWVAVNVNERAWKQAKGKLGINHFEERRMIEFLKNFDGAYPEMLRRVAAFSMKAFSHLKWLAGQEVYDSGKWKNV